MKALIFENGSKNPGLVHHVLSQVGGGCSFAIDETIVVQVQDAAVSQALELAEAAGLIFVGEMDIEKPTEDVVHLKCLFATKGPSDHRNGWLPKGEALSRFMILAGVIPAGQVDYLSYGVPKVQAMPAQKQLKFTIVNRFVIDGNFVVVDQAKFHAALLTGVGMRRSYGYGKIFAEGVENLDAWEVDKLIA